MKTPASLLAAAVAASLASSLFAATTATYTGPNNGSWNNTLNWSGAVVPNNSGPTTYDVIINNNVSTVTVQIDTINPTIDTLTINAGDALNIQDNRSLFIVNGTINNAGLLSLTSAGNNTDLILNIATLLTGGGTLSLSNRTVNRIYGAGTLTSNNVITGAGQLGINTLSFVNSGTITASLSNGLTIDPVDGPSGFINNGVLRADGGNLFLSTSTFTGGLIQARNTNIVEINGGALVQNATLQTDATAAAISLNNGILSNLTNSGAVVVTDTRVGHLAGAIQNAGTITLNSSGNNTDLALDNNVSLSGSGTVALSNRTVNRIYSTSSNNSFSTSNLITGSGQIGLNVTAITNTGIIIASSSNGLTLDPRDGASGFINSGTLRADGGNLSFLAGSYDNSGIIDARNGSVALIASGAVINGGTLTADANPSSAISLTGGQLNNLTNTGNVIVNDTNTGFLAGTITNSGFLRLNSSGNNTNFIALGDVTLASAGTLTMSNRTTNRILGNAGTERYTIFNTIMGAGQLGANTAAFTNNNLIVSTLSNGITIDPLDGPTGFINNGTLRADGGNMTLFGGTFTNNGSIQANNGSTLTLGSNATVIGGILSTNATTSAIVMTASLIDSVTNNGTLQIPDNNNGTFKGIVTNNSLVQLLSSANATSFITSGNTTLAGAGTVSMSNNTQNLIRGNIGDRLTTSNVIIGAGQIGQNGIAFTSNNLIAATLSNGITIDPLDGPTGFINNGTLRAAGGNLTLLGGTYTNNGTIEANNGSNVFLGGGATINGGTLNTNSTAGTSTIFMSGSLVDTATSNGLLAISDNNAATIKGTLTNNNNLQILSSANNTSLLISGNTLITGAGSITMSNRAVNNIYSNASGDRLTTDVLISGAGKIGLNIIAITNNGTIAATLSNGLTIDPIDGANGFINNGTVRANGGNLTLNPGDYQNANTFQALTTNTITAVSGAVITGGTLTSDNSVAAFALAGGEIANLTNTGLVNINDNNSGFFKGTLTNSGIISLNSVGNFTSFVSDGDATITGTGTITLSNRTVNRIYPSPGNRITLSLLVTGAGQIGVDQGSITNNGTIVASQSLGLTLDPAPGANGFINNGAVRASGGNMSLSPGEYANNGTFQAMIGNTISIGPGANVTGGTLTTDNSTASSAILLTGGQIANLLNTGVLAIPDNNSGILVGTITNNAIIDFRSVGNFTNLITSGNVTLAGSGSVTMSNRTSNRIYGNPNDLFTNANTITGAGQVGVDLLRINNTGAIIASLSNGLSIDPISATVSTFTNTGLLRADSATMTFLPGIYTIGGNVEAINNGSLTFTPGAVVTLSVPISLSSGTVNFNAVGTSAKPITGFGAINVGGGASVTSDAVTFSGPWTVNGTHTLRAATGNVGTSRINTVPTIPNPGKIDITDHVLLVDTTSALDKDAKVPALRTLLLAAQNGGNWLGRGITSSVAIASPVGNSVALYDAGDLSLASIGGATMNSSTLFMIVAHNGDANHDNKVDSLDLTILAAHWQTTAPSFTWSDGDLTYDGKVDSLDLTVLAANWQFAGPLEAALAQFPVFSSPSPIPEPASTFLLLPSLLVLCRRTRRLRF